VTSRCLPPPLLDLGRHGSPTCETVYAAPNTWNKGRIPWAGHLVLYGLTCYVVFLFTMVYAVGFVSGVAVPKTIDTGKIVPTGGSICCQPAPDLCLRDSAQRDGAQEKFKHRWKHFVPAALARSTYVLFSSLVLAFLFWQWCPIPARVWQIGDPQIAMAVTSLSVFGWMIARKQHLPDQPFELFGLHQVVDNFTGREPSGQALPRARVL